MLLLLRSVLGEDQELLKWSGHKRTNGESFHLYELPRGVKFMEPNRLVVARGWSGEEKWRAVI